MNDAGRSEPGNVEESMHARDYFRPFREPRIEAGSLFFDRGRRRTSLAGPWRHTPDAYDSCLRSGWYRFSTSDSVFEHYGHLAERYGVPKFARAGLRILNWLEYARNHVPLDFDFDGWEELDLPCSWNTERPEYFWYEGPMVFTRNIEPDPRPGERTFLRIGGANYRTVVFLNGRHLGTHFGGSGDFCVELTDRMIRGKNRLILSVDSTRRPDQVPMDHTDWFNYGGIYRELELVYVPREYIKDLFVRLASDGTFSRIAVDLELSDPVDGEARFSIPALGIERVLKVRSGRSREVFDAAPALWSPERPTLYDVEARFGQDRVSDRVGFREIACRNGRIYLNGQDILLKGVCIHEESLQNGKALTPDEIRENFFLAKELGCNFARLAHYPHGREAALIADEAGILLWEEIPVYWAIDFSNPETLRDARNQLAELVLRDRNRACVIVWGVGNENADWDDRLSFMSRLVEDARTLDGSRLVAAACLRNPATETIDDRLAERLDLVGINEYFGWYEPGYDKLSRIAGSFKLDKPLLVSEFGADARVGFQGSGREFFTQERQAEVYREQAKVISGLSRIRGACPWILYDFRSPKRTHPVQGLYNRKGLLDETKRIRKPAFRILQEFYGSWKS